MAISQTARYNRKIPIVPVVGGQNMAKEYGEEVITGTKKPPRGGHVLLIIFLSYKALAHGAQSGT
ncbi:hypothetical protein DDI_2608 [Dickeya dianthicola RNS04.9]|nr:hypothetical protein DDI_2608 [Dickeya dianthicola RNS04.9]